jgi:nicotinate phosphoribosyltransferase
VRAILDQRDLSQVTIFASGDLDEYRLKLLMDSRAPIDGFGIGTRLVISADAPSLDCVYKLQEYAGTPRRKGSEGKATWPGRKQIYRRITQNGRLGGDCLSLETCPYPGDPLLQPVLGKGKRLGAPESLGVIRARVEEQLALLPPALRANGTSPSYPVEVAPELKALAARLDGNAR